jgi:glutamate/aspartate transport system substrate-binding protein
MNTVVRKMLIVAAWLLLSVPSWADDSTGTLEKIRETGAITIGYRESSLPFSYYDQDQKPIGYSIDLCAKVVEAVRTELNLDHLDVKYTPVSSATRIPLISNGTVDLECGSTSNTPERQKQVAFTITHYVSATRYVALKTAHLSTVDDLKGKTVVATAGTINLRQLQQLNEDRNLGMTIVSSKDHAEGFLMVETGRADAFALDDVLLAALVANSKSPRDFTVSSAQLSAADPYGIMLRRDDPAFKKVVDDAMRTIFTSGQIVDIYNKWFMTPLPPKGIMLNIPMSDALKRVMEHPTDSGDANAYDMGRGAYHWNFGVFLDHAPDGHGASYLTTLWWGLETTLAIVVLTAPLALLMGTVVGIGRTVPVAGWRIASGAYVEVFRNTPLLVQMFMWYFVLPEFLPSGIGHWVKTVADGPFYTAIVCLSFYTSARVAEQLRAGIGQLAKGQRMAAMALGLRPLQVYRHVLLPQAFRIIFPPLTSELLNLVKNSSVALTIGVVELTARARSMQEYSFQVFEAFAAATAIYFVVTYAVTQVMRRVERRLAVPGLITQESGGH